MVAIRGTFLPYLVQHTQNISLIYIGGISFSRAMVRLLRPDTPDTASTKNFGKSVLNSKLPPRSASVALRQLKPIDKYGP